MKTRIEKVYYLGVLVGYHLGEWYLMKYEGYTGCVSWYLTKDGNYAHLEKDIFADNVEWVSSYKTGRNELKERA
jgi:hypothetical protein